MPILTPDDLSRIDSMELRARLIVEGFITGMHRSPYHGFSVEFAEHRQYNPGDDLRHVDWKVVGRKDRFYVKRFEEETNLRQMVVLDTSASMRYRGDAPVTKLHYGATLASALHALMVKQRDATGLITFDSEIRTFIPAKATRSHLQALLGTLQKLAEEPPSGSETEKTNTAHSLHAVAERLPRRGLVVLISDLFESEEGSQQQNGSLVKALQHLRHRGHEVLVFHVLDSSTERRFDFPDRPVRLRDMETQETLTLHPAQLRSEVATASDTFSARLKRRLREMRIDLVEIDTAQPYMEALSAYLIKRMRLY